MNQHTRQVILYSEDEPTKEEILNDFRQAWHEAMTGKTIPIAELWEGIENVGLTDNLDA